MYGSLRDELASQLDEIREAGHLQDRARDDDAAGRARRRRGTRRAAQPLREQLPRPRRPPGDRRGRARGARPLGLRHGVGALHLRDAGDPPRARGAALARSSAPRTRSSSARASTRTAACSRRCSASEDAVISDELNHASIIDGIRLCKAQRLRYANGDMDELEARLQEAAGARRRLIATDGVFSMDGYLAQLDADLRPRRALRRAGDGRRLARRRLRRAGRARHARALRRRSSASTSSPARSARRSAARAAATSPAGARSSSCCASARARTSSRTASRRRSSPRACAALELLEGSRELRDRLRANTARFRARMTELGFEVLPGEHPIVPVMIGDEVDGRRASPAKLVEPASTWSASLPGRARAARRGSGRRCRRRTRRRPRLRGRAVRRSEGDPRRGVTSPPMRTPSTSCACAGVLSPRLPPSGDKSPCEL